MIENCKYRSSPGKFTVVGVSVGGAMFSPFENIATTLADAKRFADSRFGTDLFAEAAVFDEKGVCLYFI